MLYTNLNHILTAEGYREFVLRCPLAVICFGRMDPFSVPLFQALEKVESAYPEVRFADMELGNPEVGLIPEFPAGIAESADPVILFFRNGMLEHTFAGTGAAVEIENMFSKLKTNKSNQ